METGVTNSSSEFRDKTYSIDQSKDCHLSVLVDRDALRYSITEADSATVRALYRYAGNGNPLESSWQESLKDIDDLQQEYRSASVAVSGVPFVLFPDVLDEKIGVLDLFKQNYSAVPQAVKQHALGESKINMAFDLPLGFEEEIHKRQPYANVTNASGLMIQSILKRHRFSKGFTVYVHVGESYIDCFVLKDTKLALFNWFAIQTKNDVLYHLLNVASQLGFDPSIVPFHITGMVDVGDATYELLKSYIPKLSPIYSLDHVKLSIGLHGVRKQHFCSLFNLFACA